MKVTANMKGDGHFRFAQGTGTESQYLHTGCHPTSTEPAFHRDEAGEAVAGVAGQGTCQGRGFPGARAGSGGRSREAAGQRAPCLAGGQLQKPPRQPGGLPGQHEAAADNGGVTLEHAADCPLGPGGCRDPRSVPTGTPARHEHRDILVNQVLLPVAQEDLSMPLIEEEIDGLSGLLFPFYDADTHMLYLAGKVAREAQRPSVAAPVKALPRKGAG